ncbi:MAG: hypothetical protein GY757_03220 [bacterium]|nr:hypothetical protein [bacterium]
MAKGQTLEKILTKLEKEIETVNKYNAETDTMQNKVETKYKKALRETTGIRAPLEPVPPGKILGRWTPPWEKDLLFNVVSPIQRMFFYIRRKFK